MDAIRVVPTTEEHVAGYQRCVDVVARERRWIGMLVGPSLAEATAFVQRVRANGGVHLVAVAEPQGTVVGWVDILRHERAGFGHGGRLGIGLLPEYRDRGLGRRLMLAALDAAREAGMERVELEVFASNARAIALYERVGFEREGVLRGARKLDGVYDDDVLMTCWLVPRPGARAEQPSDRPSRRP